MCIIDHYPLGIGAVLWNVKNGQNAYKTLPSDDDISTLESYFNVVII